jgi:hypothetical protein
MSTSTIQILCRQLALSIPAAPVTVLLMHPGVHTGALLMAGGSQGSL